MSFVLPGGPAESVIGEANFAGLRSQIAKWLNRTDLSEQILEFVRLAEHEHRRDIRIQAMEQVVAGALMNGSLNYPLDFLEARHLAVRGKRCDYVSLRTYKNLEEFSVLRNVFTHVGQTIQVRGGESAPYVLDYYAAFPFLVSDTDTNWLLQNAYDVYLWKACEKGALWLQDAEGVQTFKGLYDYALSKLRMADSLKRYSGSELTMQAPGVV